MIARWHGPAPKAPTGFEPAAEDREFRGLACCRFVDLGPSVRYARKTWEPDIELPSIGAQASEGDHMNKRIAASSRTSGTAWPSVRRGLVWLAIGISLALAGFGVASANAAPTPMVDLGQASTYAVLSGASVGNTVSAVGAPHTTIRGDLGVKANTAPTGFPPGVVAGTIRFGSSVDSAHDDLVAAYTEIASRPPGTPLAGALAGELGLWGVGMAAATVFAASAVLAARAGYWRGPSTMLGTGDSFGRVVTTPGSVARVSPQVPTA